MRVGIDVRPLVMNPAGIGRYTRELVEHLERDKYEYILYSNNNISLYNSKNVSIRVIKYNGILWHVAVFFDLLLKKVDLYHSTHSLLLPIFLPIPTVLTIHDVTGIHFPETHTIKVRTLQAFLLKTAVKRAKAILVPSERVRKELSLIESSVLPKIFVIPEGVSSRFFQRLPQVQVSEALKRLEIRGEYLLSVSTIEPRKNLEKLIEAFHLLLQIEPKSLLVIAGKVGWRSKAVFSLVQSRGLQQRIIFTGYLSEEDLSAVYQGAKLFIFPSLSEGFGLPPLEAMAEGIPCLISETTALPEIRKMKAALFFDPYSVSDIVEKIKIAWRDEQLLTTLAKTGKTVARMYSWEKMAHETTSVYQKVEE